MARVNALDTDYAESDVDEIVRTSSPDDSLSASQTDEVQLRTRNVQAIALPKTTTSEHVEWLLSRIERLSPSHKLKGGESPMRIIAMIENARGMVEIESIARSGQGYLDGLLVRFLPIFALHRSSRP